MLLQIIQRVGQHPAVSDGNIESRFFITVRVRTLIDETKHLLAINHLSKDNVLPRETLDLFASSQRDEELRRVAVLAGIPHGKQTPPVEFHFQPSLVIFERLAKRGLPTSAIAHEDITTLHNEVFDNAMHVAAFVVELPPTAPDALVASAKRNEVLHSQWCDLRPELKRYPFGRHNHGNATLLGPVKITWIELVLHTLLLCAT
mmetsp:Transcript_74091/g.171851  ORF Transcript_74091/g.171851 Transcript_74091/m.171851 type:complete len:203 (+) Transcript_74091:154-762(+)